MKKILIIIVVIFCLYPQSTHADSTPIMLAIPEFQIYKNIVNSLPLGDTITVPNDNNSVGWYPTTVGVIIAGHIFWDGTTGAFYNLHKVTLNTILYTEGEYSTWTQYKVTRIALYKSGAPTDNFPKEPSWLILVTCAGVYQNGDYTQRLVITAVPTGY